MLRVVELDRPRPQIHVDAACLRARKAQAGFASTSTKARAQLLRQLRTALIRRAQELIDVVVRESGKVRFEAITLEIVPAALALTYNAHIVERALRSRVVRPFLPLPRRATRTYAPLGVVGLITPFNYTLAIPLSSIASALAAGNAVVWKPAPSGAEAADAIVRVFEDAGMPHDLIVVVPGGADVGMALVDGPIDQLTFVGSTSAGRAVAARCGERLLPCVLELGGNAPAVVVDGADLERASRAIVYGGLANAGQSCVAVERVLAVPSVFDELLRRTQAVAEQVRVGESVARLDAQQAKKVAAWKKDALAQGAVFHGDFVVDVTQARMPVLAGEVFGPVIPFHRVANVDEAVQRANLSPQQLCAYVFAGDRRLARSIASQLKAPHVVINDAMVSYAMMELPFGGAGASGLGRVHGIDGLRALSREQIVVDGQLPIAKEPWWLPYDNKVGAVILAGLDRALRLRDRLPF